MKNREIVIRLQLPRAPRLRWLVGGAAVILCSSALVYAALTQFAPNTPIKSADVNGNFNNLDTRLAKFEAAPTWTAVTLQNGWVNYASGYYPASYAKSADGMVHVRGLIKGGTMTAGTVLFTLPAGYRPAMALDFAVVGSENTTSGFGAAVHIDAAGTVGLDSTLNANNYFGLDGISFYAEQ